MYFDQQIGGLSGGRPTIKQGSSGQDVADAQVLLGVASDGIFGPQTKAATVKFQQANGLAADGIIGPLTWAALEKPSASRMGLYAVLGVAGLGACYFVYKAVA